MKVLEDAGGCFYDKKNIREQPIIQKCPRCGFEYFDIRDKTCLHCSLNI